MNKQIFQYLVPSSSLSMTNLKQLLGFNCNKKHNKLGITQCLGFQDAINLKICTKLFHDIDMPHSATLRCTNRIIDIDIDKRKYIGKIHLSHCMSDEYHIREVIHMFPNLVELELIGVEIRHLFFSSSRFDELTLELDFFDSYIFNNIDKICLIDSFIVLNVKNNKIATKTSGFECKKMARAYCGCTQCNLCHCNTCTYGDIRQNCFFDEYRTMGILGPLGPGTIFDPDIKKPKYIYKIHKKYQKVQKPKIPRIQDRWTKRR